MIKNITFTEEEIQGLFGSLAAEDENKERLEAYFFKTDTYNKIHNFLSLRILVAHKGIGKSAIFKMSYLEDCKNNILSLWIKPDDIAELGKTSAEEDFLQLIRNWKNGLEKLILELIIRKFDLNSEYESLNKIVNRGINLLDLLKEMFQKKLNNNMDLKVGENVLKKLLLEKYLKEKKLIIYIDDLDRGWNGSDLAVKRISALLNAVRDLSNQTNGLCFRVSLRSDVYYLVRTADESTDKIDGNVLWLTWTEHQLLVLLVKRVQSFLGNNLDERELLLKKQNDLVNYLSPIMEKYFRGDGKWHNRLIHYIILSLIRRRPRDLINLCTLAARNANENKHSKIETVDWENVFDRYSQARLQDTINEHRFELPDIENLLLGMRPSKNAKKSQMPFLYTKESLMNKLNGILQKQKFYFAYNKKADAQSLLTFLYKINFIVARKEAENGFIDRRYFEDQRYISNDCVDFGYHWEVHPAFRWALYPEEKDIFKSLDCQNL